MSKRMQEHVILGALVLFLVVSFSGALVIGLAKLKLAFWLLFN